jgi:hypothetical protein
MEFQLPSVLQKKLTPYDEVRRKVEAEKKKAVRKASKPFHLGLPPLDLLIPNDVLPKNYNREELIKRISTNELKYRYLDLTYPQQKGYEEEIRHQNGKPLTFKKTDRLIHSSSGKRVQRRIILYHFEGMWTCLWVPHTDKYVYGYSFAFKDTVSNQTRFESYHDQNVRKFLVPNQYDDERTRRLKDLGSSYFNGYSWNDCSPIKIGRTNWRYKTVYVTKDMIKQGHDYDPSEGIFTNRKIESWHEKSGNLKELLKQWRRVLRGSIPVWKTADEERGYYSSRDLPLFNRIFPEQNTLGYVIKKNYEYRQENWEHTYRGEVKKENEYLVLDPMKKWDVDSLKALLFRLTNKNPLDLYERRHNIGDPFWKEGGMIEKPYFRKMLHFALKHSQDRLEASGDQTKEFVTVPIERMLHMVKWVNYILSVWPDTPIDYFQTYEEYLLLIKVPSPIKDMGYYRSRGAYERSEWLEAQAKIVEKKKKYLRQMPVKTFFEFIRKAAEEHNAQDHHSSYDFDTQMHSHMGYFREWTDTISLLDDIIGTQHTQENKPTPMGVVTGNDGRVIAQGDPIELSKPRRWRLTEFHDYLMGIQWKTRNEDFNLPQDLFAKPVKVTWQQAYADSELYQSTKDLRGVNDGKSMWSEHENSVISFFQPITSHQLADWGRAVRNCVGNSSYASAINRKRYFIVLAMVDHKPRFTIQLKLSDGVLVVDQIADIGNRRLSDEEKDFVQKSIAYALQHIAEEDPNYEPEEASK